MLKLNVLCSHFYDCLQAGSKGWICDGPFCDGKTSKTFGDSQEEPYVDMGDGNYHLCKDCAEWTSTKVFFTRTNIFYCILMSNIFFFAVLVSMHYFFK